MTGRLEVAVVIPSLTGAVGEVLESIRRQSPPPAEVEVVRGVRPSGRARNLGAARTGAPLLVFVDDDAVLGADDTLARLVAPLAADPTVAVAGAAKLLPPGSSRFQRRVAREVPRIEHPVVDRVVDADPPLDGPGYTDVTTTCCAMRRDVFEAVGGFDESLLRGVDTELFHRLRRRGDRLVMAPGAWTWHPAPATMGALLSKHFLYGVGYSQEVRRDPSRAAGRYLHTPAHAAAYLVLRTALLVPNIFLPWSHSAPSWRPSVKPLKALSSYAAALGYVYGWYRHRDGRSSASR
ncbi:MAG TPA: glycosyltransferase [Acidimicrobiales bacterium]|nr:glycosyltransferase [Acidimicrobiales bacterium]